MVLAFIMDGGLSARRARRTKSGRPEGPKAGPKGHQLEVGARMAPRLLVDNNSSTSSDTVGLESYRFPTASSAFLGTFLGTFLGKRTFLGTILGALKSARTFFGTFLSTLFCTFLEHFFGTLFKALY